MRAITQSVLVVDVESTCWDTDTERGDQPNEVIEIGICRLNMQSGEITDKKSYRVRPQTTKVSQFCTDLTGWKQEDLDDAPLIGDVLRQIEADYHLCRDNLWFSYGEYDRVKLSSTLGENGSVHWLYGITRQQNIFAQMKHFNIKTLMMLRERLTKGLGMSRALKFYGLELEGRHHNGADDAYNIAKIVHRVLT